MAKLSTYSGLELRHTNAQLEILGNDTQKRSINESELWPLRQYHRLEYHSFYEKLAGIARVKTPPLHANNKKGTAYQPTIRVDER